MSIRYYYMVWALGDKARLFRLGNELAKTAAIEAGLKPMGLSFYSYSLGDAWQQFIEFNKAATSRK